ncbi:hypothetical protein [Streptomyces decoyicus]
MGHGAESGHHGGAQEGTSSWGYGHASRRRLASRVTISGAWVVEEQRVAGVQSGDLCHLIVGEVEVEDIDVLRHALGPART